MKDEEKPRSSVEDDLLRVHNDPSSAAPNALQYDMAKPRRIEGADTGRSERCTLVPGYEPRSLSVCHLLTQSAELMNYIPEGPDGFDRSLAWTLLVAGSSATLRREWVHGA